MARIDMRGRGGKVSRVVMREHASPFFHLDTLSVNASSTSQSIYSSSTMAQVGMDGATRGTLPFPHRRSCTRTFRRRPRCVGCSQG